MLKIDNITIAYKSNSVVENFNMSIEKGQIVSIVGESGSGKTSVIRATLGLLPAGGKVIKGDINFEGESLLSFSKSKWNEIRGTQLSMIFQDNGAMMNPTKKIEDVFLEYINAHESISKKEGFEKAVSMLQKMHLPSPENVMKSYPFQLSGGMRQRVGIAMAMTYKPKLLLADEPTSALDVTIQAQIVKQMMELRQEYGTSIIMVTHNIGVAAYISDYIIVMKNGAIVDEGDKNYILNNSESEYTKTLLEAVPQIGGKSYVL